MSCDPAECVALLRGINVGGKHIVAMPELKACVQGLGYGRVRTYINSGNVLFSTSQALPRALEAQASTPPVGSTS